MNAKTETGSLARRLLVLDDDGMTGETIRRIGEFAGLESTHTASPVEFFELVEKWLPDVIALDLLMPEMDGVEVMAKLSSLECDANLIITSGVGTEVLNAASLSASGHGLNLIGVLPKPFSQAKLRSLLLQPNQREGKEKNIYQGTTSEQPTVADLRKAIESRAISVVYQPKIFCKTGTLAGFEALARWCLDGKPIPPDRFIPLAEESGLIDDLTRLIIEQALKWLAAVSEEGESNLFAGIGQAHLSINISARTLTNAPLFQWVVSLCDELAIDHHRLIFELTESSAMGDTVTALDTLTRLRMQGFKLSIDDFGTGFSSMVQLVRLPFSEIKVDKSFVMDIGASAESRAVTRSIVDLGSSLGLLSTAEGVEDQDTLDYLKTLGCDLAQGYFISRPLKDNDVVDWYRQREGERETFRLDSVKESMILGTLPERRFDRITHIARRLFDVPTSLITCLDRDTQWVKSGNADSNYRVPRDESFCTHTIMADGVLIVQDARLDTRFMELELVKGAKHVRFYAGYPVCLPNGAKVGALCLLDREPRYLSDRDIEIFQRLAAMVEDELTTPESPSDTVMEGVLSKGALRARAQATLELAETVNEPVAAILVTLDQLGDINRQFGWAMGDRCLKAVAAVINRISNPSDMVGRYRGGEIVIIRMNPSVADAQALCEDLQQSLEALSNTLHIPMHALVSIAFLDTKKPGALETAIEDARASATAVGISLEGKR
ncbi:EAL domain-containing protein [Vreelandella arcis]|uniref:Diguanylate cyclase (GGDEF) domain-containing protein n=1 Tax=Vreelandella arcis TaxID=416873 RepID=A0A1G9XPN3_9GAMM|nr:EAL domain-containing protein [Halomonas arcis]SDM98213.1 diguanylate cyclase (GGDEF) domain-containing protein [Halomonas arcis]